MDETNVRVNSLKAWILAARPKTLTGAAVPVMIGIACAVAMYGWCGIRVVPAVLCMLFALIMQVDANFVNDYFDFMKGTDDEQRLGPKRACAQGWITASAMRSGLFVTTLLACIVGLPLVYYGGWEMIMVGLACVVFCFLYTISFSYIGLGDLLVLVFFGIVPVCMTYWLTAPPTALTSIPFAVVLMSIAYAYCAHWRARRTVFVSYARTCRHHSGYCRCCVTRLARRTMDTIAINYIHAIPYMGVQRDAKYKERCRA